MADTDIELEAGAAFGTEAIPAGRATSLTKMRVIPKLCSVFYCTDVNEESETSKRPCSTRLLCSTGIQCRRLASPPPSTKTKLDLETRIVLELPVWRCQPRSRARLDEALIALALLLWEGSLQNSLCHRRLTTPSSRSVGHFSDTSHGAECKQAHLVRTSQAVSTGICAVWCGVISHTYQTKATLEGTFPVWSILTELYP